MFNLIFNLVPNIFHKTKRPLLQVEHLKSLNLKSEMVWLGASPTLKLFRVHKWPKMLQSDYLLPGAVETAQWIITHCASIGTWIQIQEALCKARHTAQVPVSENLCREWKVETGPSLWAHGSASLVYKAEKQWKPRIAHPVDKTFVTSRNVLWLMPFWVSFLYELFLIVNPISSQGSSLGALWWVEEGCFLLWVGVGGEEDEESSYLSVFIFTQDFKG